MMHSRNTEKLENSGLVSGACPLYFSTIGNRVFSFIFHYSFTHPLHTPDHSCSVLLVSCTNIKIQSVNYMSLSVKLTKKYLKCAPSQSFTNLEYIIQL